nr:MAG TPA: Transcription initiation factor IIE, alpha FINGER, Transcription [Caudoviricetes sp.]
MKGVRLIDANVAIKNAEKRYEEWNLAMAAAEGNRQINMVYKKQELFKAVKKVVESCDTIDPETLRPVAKWENECNAVGDPIVWTCTNCKDSAVLYEGTPKENGMKFCPYCGAKMEE